MFFTAKKSAQHFEHLEPRLAMAGDVAAFIGADPFGGLTALIVEGDSQANKIRVLDGAAGYARIEGLNGTTVNGKAFDEIFYELGEFSTKNIDMGSGDDIVEYISSDEAYHYTNAFINTGAGDDVVNIQSRLGAGFRVDTGNGNDSVSVFAEGIVGYIGIETGNGNDEVLVDLTPGSSHAFGIYVTGINIGTGAGNDLVHFRVTSFGDPPLLFSSLPTQIRTDTGNDIVEFYGSFRPYETFFVSLGAGDDTVIGDADEEMPPSFRMQIVGGIGYDIALNAAYFASPLPLYLFEEMDN